MKKVQVFLAEVTYEDDTGRDIVMREVFLDEATAKRANMFLNKPELYAVIVTAIDVTLSSGDITKIGICRQ